MALAVWVGWLLPSLVVWFVELGVTALFVRAVYQYAIARHAMVISADAIVMLAGRHVAGRFTRAEFASVRVDTLSYTSTDEGSHQSHENFVLVARMAAGGEERFCISDHRAQIEQIAAAIHDRMGVPLGT